MRVTLLADAVGLWHGRAMTTAAPPANPDMHLRSGLFAGIGAYTLWGLMPIYFVLLKSVPIVQIIANRIIWSAVFVVGILAVRRALPELWATLKSWRLVRPLMVSAVLIATNWMLYVWAVNSGHILAASLGYFLNPLLNVLLGFAVLRERLQPLQWVAIGVAGIGVAILAAGALSTLWVSLGLALSFGLYGLVRKTVVTGPLVGLAAETLVLLPVALAGFAWWTMQGQLVFGDDTKISLLLAFAGVYTAIPLLLFAFAARRMTLATLGLLQYIGPTLQMLLGIFVYGEHLSTAHKIAFPLIWAALALYSWSAFRANRATR